MEFDHESKGRSNLWIDFIAGTGAGVAGLLAGFPFDTVKVRFQSPQFAGRYRSTLHALVTIVREERFRGLYKGVTSPLATVGLLNGLVFASYRFCMKLQLGGAQTAPTLAQIALAGAGSGIISSVLTTPIELIKIRQQSSLASTGASARATARQIVRESGSVLGLYRGTAVTALRDCNYGAYFLAYEVVCRYFSRPPSEGEPGQRALPWSVLMFAGGVAGVAGWLFTFPVDVVKTRIQGSSYTPALPASGPPSTRTHLLAKPADANPYRTMASTVVHSYRAEGLGVFFRGLAPTLVRAIPVNMVTFGAFEALVQVLA